eukprot:c9546_g1_i2.p1 GENE.c9546_g1_i2~~c9546_g1_i2.p1  ORF type:complete len:879 (+),score=259.52 c9546_g1_i2:47-2683(+)
MPNFANIEFDEPVKKNNHPPWYQPQNGVDVGLRVNNTLTGGQRKGKSSKDELDPFIPGNGRRVLWYTCGPTVYDSCHMGHARAYLTFDILRRIVEDYFGYEVVYQINITDIDDKIILRARRNKLVADYLSKLPADQAEAFKVVLADAKQQLEAQEKKIASKSKQFEVPLPADAPSKDVEEFQTKLKEHSLKAQQFTTTNKRVALIRVVQEKGGAEAIRELEEISKTNGWLKEGSGLEAIQTALTNLVVAIQTRLEELQDRREGAKDTKDIQAEIDQEEASLARIDETLSCVQSVKAAIESGTTSALVAAARDALGERLDDLFGDSVTDHEVFNAHARKYEREYMEDMALLGVREPDVLTRVTEYVGDIIKFIEKIIANGFAYETNGNVYLDIESFKNSGHHYRKLVPFQGDTSEDAMAESEGALGAAGVKKNKNDFALWKASKRGEPEWTSPWGKGRPGWHIECSVVAGDILGQNIDVHAGGVDLRFPHHDNELAQSEACYGHHQWVNYFFHAGHLHIKGLKMSKSLKNFITIKQALKEHSPRQLRLMFLMQPWDKPMNYSDQTVDDAKKKEALFRNFFGNVKSELRKDWLASAVGFQQGEVDRKFLEFGVEVQSQVHAALCNNFDTPAVIQALCDLVSETNKYLDRPGIKAIPTLRKHALYVTRILRILGVVEGSDDIGFSLGSGEGDREAQITPYVGALVDFRDKVRAAALLSKDVPVLQTCDSIRDDVLPGLGVRVEDKTDGSLWKLDNPAVLKQEIEEKRRKQNEAQAKKVEGQLKKKLEEIAKATEAVTPPDQLYRSNPEYSEFDETGVPTKDKAGTEISKAQIKKMKKQVEGQAKLHSQYIEKFGSKEGIEQHLKALESEAEELQKQVKSLS